MYQQISIQYSCSFYLNKTIQEIIQKKNNMQNDFEKHLLTTLAIVLLLKCVMY